MIIPVQILEKCGIYVEHARLQAGKISKLQARRYRYDLKKGETPSQIIILLRVGESSRNGHYTLLRYDTLPQEFENFRLMTPSNDDLTASELRVSNSLIYC
jgi:hypothetical protein